MDEFTAVLRARAVVNQVNPSTIPVSVEAYAAHVGAVIRFEDDLGPDEPGWSFECNGKHYICVNENDEDDRQRFTVCHEIGHIELGISSDHKGLPWWSYAKRSPAEICCDVFAAELLLPPRLFKPLADRAEIGFTAIDVLADRFVASRTATGSRFATVIGIPCAFVISEEGKVRYASRSAPLREAKAWIEPRCDLPEDSVSRRARSGEIVGEADEVAADIWFSDWRRGGVLVEEARHLSRWDQTLTLLWFEDEELPPPARGSREDEEELGLKELDGILPWPGKKRQR